MSRNYTSFDDSARPLPPVPPAGPVQTLASQDEIMRQQDAQLDQLSRSVATLHRMGNEIHGELLVQAS